MNNRDKTKYFYLYQSRSNIDPVISVAYRILDKNGIKTIEFGHAISARGDQFVKKMGSFIASGRLNKKPISIPFDGKFAISKIIKHIAESPNSFSRTANKIAIEVINEANEVGDICLIPR